MRARSIHGELTGKDMKLGEASLLFPIDDERQRCWCCCQWLLETAKRDSFVRGKRCCYSLSSPPPFLCDASRSSTRLCGIGSCRFLAAGHLSFFFYYHHSEVKRRERLRFMDIGSLEGVFINEKFKSANSGTFFSAFFFVGGVGVGKARGFE